MTPAAVTLPHPNPEETHMPESAGRFNELYPVGTPVTAYPDARAEDDKGCTRLVTRTRTAAWVLSGHTPVVMVEGHGACIALTHVDPR